MFKKILHLIQINEIILPEENDTQKKVIAFYNAKIANHE